MPGDAGIHLSKEHLKDCKWIHEYQRITKNVDPREWYTLWLPLNAFCTCVSLGDVKQCQTSLCLLPDCCCEICPPGILCKQNDCMHIQLHTLYEQNIYDGTPLHIKQTYVVADAILEDSQVVLFYVSLCTFGCGALLGWKLAPFPLRTWISSSRCGCRPSHLGKRWGPICLLEMDVLCVCEFLLLQVC